LLEAALPLLEFWHQIEGPVAVSRDLQGTGPVILSDLASVDNNVGFSVGLVEDEELALKLAVDVKLAVGVLAGASYPAVDVYLEVVELDALLLAELGVPAGGWADALVAPVHVVVDLKFVLDGLWLIDLVLDLDLILDDAVLWGILDFDLVG
jgi:hypothetical protein